MRNLNQLLGAIALLLSVTLYAGACWAAEQSAAADEKPKDTSDAALMAIYKMPAYVQRVVKVCPWRSKSGQGAIRLTQTEQQGAHKLYVQWLREGLAGTETRAVSTIAIEEINNDSYYRFNMPAAELMPGSCKLSTEMEDLRTQRRFRLNLFLEGPGKYQYQLTRLLDGDL